MQWVTTVGPPNRVDRMPDPNHRCSGAFKADVTEKDPERKGITPKNLAYYYEKSRILFSC